MTQHTCLDTTGILTPTQSHKKLGFYSDVLLRKRGGGKLTIFAPSSRDANASSWYMFQIGSEGLIFMKSGCS